MQLSALCEILYILLECENAENTLDTSDDPFIFGCQDFSGEKTRRKSFLPQALLIHATPLTLDLGAGFSNIKMHYWIVYWLLTAPLENLKMKVFHSVCLVLKFQKTEARIWNFRSNKLIAEIYLTINSGNFSAQLYWVWPHRPINFKSQLIGQMWQANSSHSKFSI